MKLIPDPKRPKEQIAQHIESQLTNTLNYLNQLSLLVIHHIEPPPKDSYEKPLDGLNQCMYIIGQLQAEFSRANNSPVSGIILEENKEKEK